ncbi:MAG: prolyl oligopeptidase family serine peptidase [Planctomycetota bacterium]|nr:prolyl oligopeptidase family serine peptidase [Planctomycetota bacterium]
MQNRPAPRPTTRLHAPARFLVLVPVLVLVLAASTAPAAAQGRVIDERVNPRWIDPDHLEFSRTEDGTVRRLRIHRETGVLSAATAEAGGGDRAPGRRVTASRGRGGEVPIRFENDTQQPIRIMWVNHDGTEVPYGRLAAGKQTGMGTYDGHAWRILDEDGGTLTAFIAEPGRPRARVDERSIREWRASTEGTTADDPAAGVTDPTPPAKVTTRKGDLWIERPGEEPQRLTTDARPGSAWRSQVVFSPDGRYFLARKVDAPQEHPVHLLEVRPEDQVEPILRTHQYLKPGDRIARPHPAVFEVATGRRIDLDPELAPNPWSITEVSWHPEAARVRMLYNQRGHQVLRLLELDAVSGEGRVLIDETSDTFIDYAGKRFLHVMDDGDRAIWMTERSGWNHLELVDLVTGTRRPITSGEWVVRAVDDVDEDAGTVRIRALGLDPDQDPYHVHHAVVDLESGELTRLTEGDGTHELEFSPDGRHYLDRWSRVDLPPVHELRRTRDGSLVAVLAEADHAPLLDTGWRPPIRFTAKGRDGRTDIWGIIITPREFDPEATYPVVEHIYAGPHDHFVPKKFSRRTRMREVADLGVVVVQIDGMGTNWRSKAFHDVAWRNLGDSGFPDRIAWMKAAAATRPWMDLDRVGIYGGSAGGQSAMRALLAHGDFYDVAVADCGCHDNRMDKIWWNELWMGWPVGDHYAEQSNVTNAHRLEGELLLVLGGMDRNVDPASTLQVVDALVRADKDFEFILIPSGGHGAGGSPYGWRRSLEFLQRHLVER